MSSRKYNGYDFDGNYFYIGGMNLLKSAKYKNILKNNKVSLVIDDLKSIDPWDPRGMRIYRIADIVTRQGGYIGFLKIGHFNRILKSIFDLTPRVLSMRLRELENEGFIECVGKKRQQSLMVVWKLTEKGRDTLPILMQLTAFGSKWHADLVFEDKRTRIYMSSFLNQKQEI